MSITIRRAEQSDCAALLDLIKELAFYERAPEQVTVSLEHFIASGFGEKPVWWAFVAEVENTPSTTITQHKAPSPSGRAGEGQNNNSPSGSPDSSGGKGLVAFALYYIRYSTWKGQRMYLEDILVTEAYRGKGIGTLLMDRLIVEMKERGLNGMLWQVLEWNEPAIHFYKKYNAHFDGEWINVSIENHQQG